MTNALGYVNKRSGLHTRKSVLKFGKYKGKTIEYVLDKEPSWLVWAFNEIEGFDLETSVITDAEYASREEDDYGLDQYGFYDNFYDD